MIRRRSFNPPQLDGLESRVVLSTLGMMPKTAHVATLHHAAAGHPSRHQHAESLDQRSDQQSDGGRDKGLTLQQDGVRDQAVTLHGKK